MSLKDDEIKDVGSIPMCLPAIVHALSYNLGFSFPLPFRFLRRWQGKYQLVEVEDDGSGEGSGEAALGKLSQAQI